MKSPPLDRESSVTALIRSRQHLQADPADTAALFAQAVALCQLGQWEQALDAWEQVTCLEPGNAYAYLNRGIVYLQQEQWRLAEAAFDAAIRCAPEHAEAHFGLGVAYAQQERFEAAHSAWQAALRLDPTHLEAQANLVMLARMSTTEVESLNFGSTQTMQLDCIVAPSTAAVLQAWENNSQPDTREHETRPSAYVSPERPDLAQDSPVEPPEEAADYAISCNEIVPSNAHRIKLPPPMGPALGTIAEAVVAAQAVRAQETEAIPQGHADGTTSVLLPARPEPTLKLDGKALKREHARLAAAGDPAAQNRAAGLLRSVAWIGGAVVVAVGLTLWGVQRFHTPADSVASPQSSTALAPPSSAANMPTPSRAPNPNLANTPVVVEPVPTISTDSLRPSALAAQPRETVRETPISRRQMKNRVEKRAFAAATPRSLRHRSESSVTAKSRSTPRPLQTRTRFREADEDTFAAHRRPGHANSAEEWTDHIP